MHINKYLPSYSQFVYKSISLSVFQLDVTCPFEELRGKRASVAKNKRNWEEFKLLIWKVTLARNLGGR
jgi:hypothetical protein